MLRMALDGVFGDPFGETALKIAVALIGGTKDWRI
jgi:hypothetical protein